MGIDWIILADAAEVLNNKLYLLGGGWETLTINFPLPVHHPCAVAVAVNVPWNETNQRHTLEIEIAHEDGDVLIKFEAQLEVGRPPGIPLGLAQRVQLAVTMQLPLKRLGTHATSARIEGQELKRVPFNVVPGPMFHGTQPQVDPPK